MRIRSIFLPNNGHEADAVARLVEEGVCTLGREKFERSPPNDLPAARAVDGVHARLGFGNAHGAAGKNRPRSLAPGRVDTFVQPAQVAEPGGEANHVDRIVRRSVDGDNLLHGQAAVFRHNFDVGPELTAIEDRDLDNPGRRDIHLVKSCFQTLQDRQEFLRGCDQGVVDERQVAIGRNDGIDTLGKSPLQKGGHGTHLLVHGGVDHVAVFDENGSIAADADAWFVEQ